MRAPLNLALQGGGAHGAFTWGVLDALLGESDFPIEGVSGTSAGAMNALCLAHGWMQGGRDGARRALADFWHAVAAQSAPFSLPKALQGSMAPAMKMMLQWSDHLSPEQLNPLDLNPLRDVLHAQFDFERLRRDCPIQLFIAATHANSGKVRIFRNPELSADSFLASACLPTIHHTVTIDGEPYWDGGYSANPAVFPLLHHCPSPDILLVLLTPLHYNETPYSATDIRQRLRELAFNATFLREMRMFAHMREQIGTPRLPDWLPFGKFERRIARLRFHAIAGDHVLSEFPAESKLAVNLPFFETLRDLGSQHARRWLSAHRQDIGQRASLDLNQVFY